MNLDISPSSVQKPKRNHLEEFLPLYRKFGDSSTEIKSLNKTFDNHDSTPNRKRTPSKRKTHEKQEMDVSLITIDGPGLNTTTAGGTTPFNNSKVTSTPVEIPKKKILSNKSKLKSNNSSIEQSKDNLSVNMANTESKKRSKSVSFMLEDNEQTIIKKPKSNDSLEEVMGDTPKGKKSNHKKNKKSEKENKVDFHEMPVNEPTKKKNRTSKLKPNSEEITENEDIPSIQINKEGTATKVKKIKNIQDKTSKEEGQKEFTGKSSKAKKQKHQDKQAGDEPAAKALKTEVISEDLQNLNLGDNTHTLTDLINDMTVVDKTRQKKKRKTANREKKQNPNIKKHPIQNYLENQTEDKDLESSDSYKTNGNESGGDHLKKSEDVENGEKNAEKKKWQKKRWNKFQKNERDQNTTINVDNLPVSLLKGNFKKTLIDHFSKYGLYRSTGEPIVQNEGNPAATFSTKVYFDSAETAREALEMDGSTVAGNRIQLSSAQPSTETVLVLRIYGHPDKLSARDIMTEFGPLGVIRSIRPFLRKKKTMSTVFVEFDSGETVQKALAKCTNLTINGHKVMASRFVHKDKDKDSSSDKEKEKKKHRRKRGLKKKGAKGDGGDKKMPIACDKTSPEDSDSESGDE